jgi:hypothetical protein
MAQRGDNWRRRQARMEGTPVTAETWNAWFDRFKAEKALEKAKALSNTDFKQKLRQVRLQPRVTACPRVCGARRT